MNTIPQVTATPITLAQQVIFRTANSNDELENLMTFLPVGSIREFSLLMYIMADGSAVVLDSAGEGYYALPMIDGCGGNVVTSSRRGGIVTATATGGKAIAKGASSCAVAMGKGATATALGDGSIVAVGYGRGKVGRNGRAISTTKAGILRGGVGSTLRWADGDLVKGVLEITVGHGEGEARPNEDYGLGRYGNQWVITHTIP